MSNSKDIIRKAFNKKKILSAKKHEELDDIAFNMKSGSRGAMQDFNDTDRYNSSSKREPIPYERQRELGISKRTKPNGIYVDADTAWNRRMKTRKGRKK